MNFLRNLSLLSVLFLSTLSYAGLIKAQAKHFTKTGLIDQFKWAPTRYQNDFKYDVFYFIPEHIKDSENVPALVFMHGGGDSTVTREGSAKTARFYLKDLGQRLANETNSVVVMPSGSGLNWGSHILMIRDLTQLMRKELTINPNNIGLAGHSMGGMGITRSFPLLMDEFAYFVPMAAGMDLKIQTDERLDMIFNTSYVHLQGEKDHFKIFMERSVSQSKRMQQREEKLGKKSGFELIVYPGNHDYDRDLTINTIKRLQQKERNIYQSQLYGMLSVADRFMTDNKITYHFAGTKRYFWVQVLESTADANTSETVTFVAEVKDNEIHINFHKRPEVIKKLRILLSSKLLDLHQNVRVFINGELKEEHVPAESEFIADETDESFSFEDFMDVTL